MTIGQQLKLKQSEIKLSSETAEIIFNEAKETVVKRLFELLGQGYRSANFRLYEVSKTYGSLCLPLQKEVKPQLIAALEKWGSLEDLYMSFLDREWSEAFSVGLGV